MLRTYNAAVATDEAEGADAEATREDSKTTPASKAAAHGDGTADTPMEIVDVDDLETEPKPAVTEPLLAAQNQVTTQQPVQHPTSYPGGYTIDVCFEASKLPLDVAIFNSARAAGGDEKIRKYLQGVLVVGGCALVPGMAHALESR